MSRTNSPTRSASPPQPLADPPAIRLVAIDLDGTLLTDSKQISSRTARALCALQRRDVKVVIASARPPRSVRPIYRMLGLQTLQINYNGALIWDEPKNEVIFHRPMSPAIVRQIIEVARDMFEETLVTCEILDRWYTDYHDEHFNTETGKLFKPDVIAPLETFCNQPITKLLLLGEPRIMSRLEPLIAESFQGHISLMRTDDHMLQIMDRRVSKAVALQKVAKIYDIPMSQVMAIGDAPNDVGMLQASGVAIAMDNAHKVVKRVAHWVAPSNNDHGVYAALVRYGLCDGE